MTSKDLTFLFGLAVAYAPHRSIDLRRRGAIVTERRHLRVRGLPLLRRVQDDEAPPRSTGSGIHRRQSLRRGSRCGLRGENTKFLGRSKLRRKKIELKAKALTVP